MSFATASVPSTGIPGTDHAASDRGAGAPVRVLLLCDHIGYDERLHGSGRMMVAMATAFDPARVQIIPVVLQKEGALGRSLRDEGNPVRFLGYHRFNPLQVLALVRLIRRHRPHVLHVWDFGACTYGRLAAMLTGTPVVVHVRSHHSVHQRRGYPAYVSFAYRQLAPYTSAVVANSESTRHFAIERMGFPAPMVHTLHNPVPDDLLHPADPSAVAQLRSAYGLPHGTPVITAITRFYPAKGIGFLVSAFAAVSSEFPAARLLLVGDGPLRQELETQARELGVSDRVIFAGFQRDVVAHLALSTICVVPSIEEALGNSAIEGVAAGVPVVASREGGLPEVVSEGRSGLLVPPGDARALARTLRRLLQEPAVLEHLREGCREERQRFSVRHYTTSLERLYRRTVQHPRAGRRRSRGRR